MISGSVISRVSCHPVRRPRRMILCAMVFCLGLSLQAEQVGSQEAALRSPRDFFNAGTRQLSAGKLQEAETLLQNAVATQNPQIQTRALFNLGNVRVAQGAEILKKEPSGSQVAGRGQDAAGNALETARHAGEALASNEVEKMVAAYVRGRGSRRELRAATEAVARALKEHGAVLVKWQRGAADFKSVVELQGVDEDAQFNADATDRAIAGLVDKINQLQQAGAMLAGAKGKLDEKMEGLKGKIPAPNMPPGAPGDEEQEEDSPFGPNPGQKEGMGREGKEMPISPQEAADILAGYKLGAGRPLPMGQGDQKKPRDASRSDW